MLTSFRFLARVADDTEEIVAELWSFLPPTSLQMYPELYSYWNRCLK